MLLETELAVLFVLQCVEFCTVNLGSCSSLIWCISSNYCTPIHHNILGLNQTQRPVKTLHRFSDEMHQISDEPPPKFTVRNSTHCMRQHRTKRASSTVSFCVTASCVCSRITFGNGYKKYVQWGEIVCQRAFKFHVVFEILCMYW